MSIRDSHAPLCYQNWQRVGYVMAVGSITTILFSIAISQLLLGLAIAILLLSGVEFRFPPVKAPLALFFALDCLVSPAFWRSGPRSSPDQEVLRLRHASRLCSAPFELLKV